jgi:hypothetical protein
MIVICTHSFSIIDCYPKMEEPPQPPPMESPPKPTMMEDEEDKEPPLHQPTQKRKTCWTNPRMAKRTRSKN